MTSKTDIPSSSSSSPPFRKFTYDVFLSFRGEDTRKTFTDHLYTALTEKGIFTFRDDEELKRGESIGPNLLKAIEESRYVIVIFSKNYANSSWCLDEIAKVAECMEKGQEVFPVFYHVDPSDYFGKPFEERQKLIEENKRQRWKDALVRVGKLSGWHIKDGYESKYIHEIVQQIFIKLNQIISTSEGLVGMDSHLKEMLSHLDIGYPDVRIVGICGMGGIGKTTLAHVVFNRIKAQFESYSFLENVREESEKQGTLIHLQKKLLLNLLNTNADVQNTEVGREIIRHRLCTKRVLIILDDVDQEEQFEALCDRTWFGQGSRIILTSRDEHLLRVSQADRVYKVSPLSDAEALQLFSLKAFKGDQLGGDFLKLSEEFIKYAVGLPLAIKVLGSSVYSKNVGQWSSALDRLKISPGKKFIGVLKWSFDGLEESEKRVFLDIACFFKGKNFDRVRRILQGSNDCCPDTDLQVLLDKSMITLSKKKLWMHDTMQALGWTIVLEETEPERRSRLWRSNEIIRILDRRKATSRVQSISLLGPKNDDVVYSFNDSFSEMDNLRLLRIKDVKFSGNIKYLSNELQYLQWHECPLGSFPSDFQPDNLVELKLHSSYIQHLWTGENGWSMLLFIDLRGSKFLRSTPDFTKVPNLEKLNLYDCTSLVNIHPSLGCLKKLKVLDMTNCESVESLPPFSNLESLRYLSLAFCSSLKRFMEIEGDMKALLYLSLACTNIEELPTSVACLTGLQRLHLHHCKKLLRLPRAIRCLESLETLSLLGCANINELPDGMKNLKSLSCCGCKGLASESGKGLRSLWSLTGLIDLNLSDCSLTDGAIPDDLSSLVSLKVLDLSGNNFVRLPDSISQLSKLEDLRLSDCTQLQLVPKLSSSDPIVNARGCNSLTDFPNQIKTLPSPDGGFTVIDSRNSDDSSHGETIKIRFHTPSEEDCSVYLQLTIGEYHMNLFEKCVRSSKEPHQLLFIYIPRAEIIQEFSQASQTDLDMVFRTDSPGSELQMIGLDIVNRQEGLEEFVETIIHCMQRADDPKFHENTVIASWIDLLRLKGDSCTPTKCYTRARWERKFELLSQKYRKWDWSASGFDCFFYGTEICRKKWFMHFNEGNSAEIQLPSNLLGDPNWLGIAVCAIFWRTHEDQNIILDTPDSDTNELSWHLEFNVAGARLCTTSVHQSIRKLRLMGALADCSHCTDFAYVPRIILKVRGQWSSAKVTFTSSSPCLGVSRCALRLVYKDDIEDLVHSLTLCELP